MSADFIIARKGNLMTKSPPLLKESFHVKRSSGCAGAVSDLLHSLISLEGNLAKSGLVHAETSLKLGRMTENDSKRKPTIH